MVNYFKLKDFKLNFKLIEIYRNPVDTVMSWYNKGWGQDLLMILDLGL